MPLTRKLLVKLVVGTLAVIAAASVPAVTHARPTAHLLDESSPNILIIITDDQRARGTLSVMPSLREWFEGQGTRFPHAYTTTPTCCPARSSIFTGLYVHNHGVYTSQPGDGENLDQSRTIQHALQEAGYTTGLFGKYLNGWPVLNPPPDFSRFAMFSDQSERYYKHGLWNIDGAIERVSTYSTVFIETLAERFILETEADDARPWMLLVTPMAPHAPFMPHRTDRTAEVPPFEVTPAMLEMDRDDKPEFVRDQGPSLRKMRERRAGQLRTLMAVDRMVDTLHEALVETGEIENTLAFFISDNGLMWGEHALTGKGVAYEPAVHVPLLMTWPAGAVPGTIDERLVANIDIPATVYDAVGIEPPAPIDGRSLLDPYARTRLLLEYWMRPDRESPNWAAHRTADYKYIESYSTEHLVPGFVEYYSYPDDPWELENLLGEGAAAPPDTELMSTELRRDLVCSGTEGPTACP